MEMGVLSSFVLLLVCSMHADARQWMEPMFMDQSDGNKISSMEGVSLEGTCDSCLEVSRKAGKTLSDPKLFMEVSLLTSEVCRTLPSHLRIKCLQTTGAYLDQTRLFMQDFFNGETLCNSTGLCLDKSMPPTNNNLISVDWILKELTDERACDACRRTVKDVLTQFQQSKMRMKIMDALLEYCEEAEDDVDKCKQTIYKYVPVVFTKLNKMRPNELCRLVGFCDEGISM